MVTLLLKIPIVDFFKTQCTLYLIQVNGLLLVEGREGT